MGKTKFKISQFVPILPFGYTSKQALCIGVSDNPDAWVEYDPYTSMAERELICSRQWQYAYVHIKSMIKQGFLEEVERKYGKYEWEVFQQVRLTEYGYNLVTGNCTDENEYTRISACVDSGMAYRVASGYIPKDTVATHLMLQETKKQTGCDHPIFVNTLMRIIDRDDATLMAYNSPPATAIDLASQSYNGHQQYRSWRASNINALFRANGFLTCIDRRPITTVTSVPETGESTQVNKAFYDCCMSVLDQWYEQEENAFLFAYPWAKKSSGLSFGSNTLPWEQIPAFYSAYEFPSFSGMLSKSETENKTNALHLSRHNFAGVAIGLMHNYLVYHTRPQHTSLSEKIEENSCMTVQQNINLINEQTPILGANREIRNAIIVCPSAKQFYSLFVNLKKKRKHKSTMEPTNGVFDSMCIVPLNNSGVVQLRRLMASSPIECETELLYRLADTYPQFQRTNDPIYQFAYKNKPVHVAHFMIYDKLYSAWKAYQHGHRFYIMCYPEQAKFLRQIFPDAEFL